MVSERRTRGESSSSTAIERRAMSARRGVGKGMWRVSVQGKLELDNATVGASCADGAILM